MDMRKPFTWHFLMCNNSYSNQSQLQSSRTKRYSDSRQKWKQRMNPHLFPVLARLPTTGHADRESEEESRLHLPGRSRWWKRYKAQKSSTCRKTDRDFRLCNDSAGSLLNVEEKLTTASISPTLRTLVFASRLVGQWKTNFSSSSPSRVPQLGLKRNSWVNLVPDMTIGLTEELPVSPVCCTHWSADLAAGDRDEDDFENWWFFNQWEDF